jgi:hypothetical protein
MSGSIPFYVKTPSCKTVIQCYPQKCQFVCFFLQYLSLKESSPKSMHVLSVKVTWMTTWTTHTEEAHNLHQC